MRIKIHHRQPNGQTETELWYDVDIAWLDPSDCDDAQWLTMIFYQDSPNAKKFKYGETSIEIIPTLDDIAFYND